MHGHRQSQRGELSQAKGWLFRMTSGIPLGMAVLPEPPMGSLPYCRGALVVRPIERGRVARFNSELVQHHWLGHRLAGETMRYGATEDERWVALVGFGSAAYKCSVRERHLGWSNEAQSRQIAVVVNNQRFCVLPDGRRKNFASQVLCKTLRRLSADYEAVYGHPVLAVETFTDPKRHLGAGYTAANFLRLEETAGSRRSGGRRCAGWCLCAGKQRRSSALRSSSY